MRSILAAALTAATLLLGASAAGAAESYSFSVAALAGLGGTSDAEPSPGFDHPGFQLGLGMVIAPQTHLVLRVGQLDAGGGDRGLGSFADADLTYATLGAEYRYPHTWYDSGLYLALGAYELDGGDRVGLAQSESAIGAAFGATGDFRIARRLSLVIELSAHWADLEEANVFLMGHGGLSVKF